MSYRSGTRYRRSNYVNRSFGSKPVEAVWQRSNKKRGYLFVITGQNIPPPQQSGGVLEQPPIPPTPQPFGHVLRLYKPVAFYNNKIKEQLKPIMTNK